MAGATETCEEENMGEETLVPKRHSTSVIWKYFGFTKDDPLQTQVLCKSCPAVVATSRGTTTNLHSHLTQPQRSVRSAPRSPQSKTTDYSGSSKAVRQASIPQSSRGSGSAPCPHTKRISEPRWTPQTVKQTLWLSGSSIRSATHI